MPEQRDVDKMGATMRLGAYPCKILNKNSKTYEAYGEEVIYERHRHRYEFNNDYREALTNSGLSLVGVSPNDKLVEIVEDMNHPWFVGVQFHPELKSRPTRHTPCSGSSSGRPRKTETSDKNAMRETASHFLYGQSLSNSI